MRKRCTQDNADCDGATLNGGLLTATVSPAILHYSREKNNSGGKQNEHHLRPCASSTGIVYIAQKATLERTSAPELEAPRSTFGVDSRGIALRKKCDLDRSRVVEEADCLQIS